MKITIRILLLSLLLFYIGCSSQEKKWDEVKRKNTIAAYKEFIEKYPSGNYSSQAKKNLEKLEWFNSKNVNSIKSYIAFLKTYSNSEYAKKVDSSLWACVQKDGSDSAYRNYLSVLTQPIFKQEASNELYYINYSSTLEDSLKISKNKDQIIKKIEALLTKKYRTGNTGKTFYINTNITDMNISPCSITFVGIAEIPGLVQTISEFPHDYMVFNMGSMQPQTLGCYSIHRFSGIIPFNVGEYIKIIGNGDKYNRLTFILLEDKFIYLRGQGKVVKKNGQEIRLGY